MTGLLDPGLAWSGWLLVGFSLLAAGLVKGTIGFGLPLVAVSLLASSIAVEPALAYVTLPILATNLTQSLDGGLFRPLLKRFWPVIVCLGLGIGIGAWIAAGIDRRTLFALLGLVVMGYVGLELSHWRPVLTPRREGPVGALFGLVAGIIGGITTAYGVLLAIYLNALHLPRETFIAAVGVIWFSGSLFLLASFGAVEIMTGPRLMVSALAVAPALAGLWLGRKIRHKVDEMLFRRLVLLAITVAGLNLLRRGFF